VNRITNITSSEITKDVTIDTGTAGVAISIGRQTASAPLFPFLIRSCKTVVVKREACVGEGVRG